MLAALGLGHVFGDQQSELLAVERQGTGQQAHRELPIVRANTVKVEHARSESGARPGALDNIRQTQIRNQDLDRQGQGLFAEASEEDLGGRIEQADPPVDVGQDHAVRDGAEQRAQGLARRIQIREVAQLRAGERAETQIDEEGDRRRRHRDADRQEQRDPELGVWSARSLGNCGHPLAIIPGDQGQGQGRAAQGDQIAPCCQSRRGGNNPPGFPGMPNQTVQTQTHGRAQAALRPSRR